MIHVSPLGVLKSVTEILAVPSLPGGHINHLMWQGSLTTHWEDPLVKHWEVDGQQTILLMFVAHDGSVQ